MKLLNQNEIKNGVISEKIIDFNEDFTSTLEQMKNICLENKAYAIAAPQVGIYRRFILIVTKEEMTNKKDNEIDYLINPYFNPVIVYKKGLQCFYEACMSVPKAIGKVYRPYEIKIKAQDIKGNNITKIVKGFEAIIFCHEIDHLDGIEYTKKAYDMRYNIDYDKKIEIRKDNPHKIIRKTGNYEELLKEVDYESNNIRR